MQGLAQSRSPVEKRGIFLEHQTATRRNEINKNSNFNIVYMYSKYNTVNSGAMLECLQFTHFLIIHFWMLFAKPVRNF